VIADGVDDLDAIVVEPFDRPCPRCGAACNIDPVAVARDGEPAGWARSTETVHLQDLLLGRLAFDVGWFDGGRTLSGIGRVRPFVGRQRCVTCRAELLVVVSFGEVQPARYWLVFDGLVAADDRGRPGNSADVGG
jgi:hypothetical protein